MYLTNDDNEHKKAKGTRKCVIKREITFKYCTDCLLNKHRFKSYNHGVYTEEVNKIAFSANDDKRLQTHDKITTYPYGINGFKVCESEMLNSKSFIL